MTTKTEKVLLSKVKSQAEYIEVLKEQIRGLQTGGKIIYKKDTAKINIANKRIDELSHKIELLEAIIANGEKQNAKLLEKIAEMESENDNE
ncbi:hypothetical protein EQG49_02440 [Periweissella cryptocerci]|uniref:Uncharacterized protein n=1 Tax=Periweissella cryptocerci TaxID=2506420 RepID=A0A4P6YS22_9LACO|nr:hypothetical protein [Periweissella cryptocerci]QBO35403.1 hypothetical protein EQG49_02440 [Periweissella cryptocerci]